MFLRLYRNTISSCPACFVSSSLPGIAVPSQMKIINLMQHCWVAASRTPVDLNADRHATHSTSDRYPSFLSYHMSSSIISDCDHRCLYNICPLVRVCFVCRNITAIGVAKRGKVGQPNVRDGIIVYGITGIVTRCLISLYNFSNSKLALRNDCVYVCFTFISNNLTIDYLGCFRVMLYL